MAVSPVPGVGYDDGKLAVVSGDLLEAAEDKICHQCNCVTEYAAGLASAVFRKFPTANRYTRRRHRLEQDVPGTIYVDPHSKVVNLYGQLQPGSPRGEKRSIRLTWFDTCLGGLLLLGSPSDPVSFAFPWQIGCGLAGGNWEDYYQKLSQFSRHPHVRRVVIYCLPTKE